MNPTGKDPQRIGDCEEWQALAEAAWQNQQRRLGSAEGRELARERNAQQLALDEAERERAALRPYLPLGIPRLTALALAHGVDHHGRKLGITKLDRELTSGMAQGRLLVCLLGPVGTGKTVAACRLLAKHGGLFVPVGRLVELSARYEPDRVKLSELRMAKLLVLDEVGSEDERDILRVESLLRERYEDARPTILIANLTPQLFQVRYGDRVARRIWSHGHMVPCTRVLCPGEQGRQLSLVAK